MTHWIEFNTAGDVAASAADTIEDYSRNAIQQRGEFKLVLAGGSTPVACYEILARRDLDWDRWKLFYGDERCLAPDDNERNHQIVAASGLSEKIKQHYIIPAELGPIKGAESYASTIADQLPFDIVLLGMGEDGHTASLFPGLDWNKGDSGNLTLAVSGAPKPPPERVSLTLPVLQNCRQMLVLITGESKRQAVSDWKQGVELPVAQVSRLDQASIYIESDLMR